MVMPAHAATQRTWNLGQFRDSATIVGDISAPPDEAWDALRT
jgi:hypothetical protein